MGIYAKYVLPRIIDLAMRNQDTTRLRSEWIPRARGNVLEIGIGSGLNLPFYSSTVSHVGVDPSLELQQLAFQKQRIHSNKIEFLTQSAEEAIGLPAASVDTAVITWTLCSIPDPARALEQVKRVLKPEGRLIFVEHGHAPDPSVAKWQGRLTPFWKRITGGCHLNRKVDEIISAAGFRIFELERHYLPGPRPMTFTYKGIAEIRQ